MSSSSLELEKHAHAAIPFSPLHADRAARWADCGLADLAAHQIGSQRGRRLVALVRVGAEVRGAGGGPALDGEVANPADAAALPSGNGEPGGAAVVRFEVTSAVRARLPRQGVAGGASSVRSATR
jgi:hypothetical protein